MLGKIMEFFIKSQNIMEFFIMKFSSSHELFSSCFSETELKCFSDIELPILTDSVNPSREYLAHLNWMSTPVGSQ